MLLLRLLCVVVARSVLYVFCCVRVLFVLVCYVFGVLCVIRVLICWCVDVWLCSVCLCAVVCVSYVLLVWLCVVCALLCWFAYVVVLFRGVLSCSWCV